MVGREVCIGVLVGCWMGGGLAERVGAGGWLKVIAAGLVLGAGGMMVWCWC